MALPPRNFGPAPLVFGNAGRATVGDQRATTMWAAVGTARTSPSM